VLEQHLREHSAHYSFALFQSLPPQEQLNHIELAMAGVEVPFTPGYFQPRAVGQIGRRLLIPLNDQMIPFAVELLRQLKDDIDVPVLSDTVLLPSPGMTIEARLGHCSAGEDFIEESRAIDLDLRRVAGFRGRARPHPAQNAHLAKRGLPSESSLVRSSSLVDG